MSTVPVPTRPLPSIFERALAAEQAKLLCVVSRRVLVIRKRAV